MPDTLGVIGGGQLGAFFVRAAKSLGFRTMVLEPDPHSPAGAIADIHLIAAYDDATSLQQMAETCRGVTIEFENAPTTSLQFLAQHTIVQPAADAVAITQDRRREKLFCVSIGLATAPFAVIESADDISSLDITFPAILKTAQLGYDGKGQRRVTTTEQVRDAWYGFGCVPCVLEQIVPLQAELSVIVARNHEGNTVAFAPTLNVHVNGILDASTAPLTIRQLDQHGILKPSDLLAEAQNAARHIAQQLNYVGVLGIEFFIASDCLLVNELAPRPHNSGHWTIDATLCSQFEQQVRILAGLPLGDTAMIRPAVAMVNLLGEHWPLGEQYAALESLGHHEYLYPYGKQQARPGRKMGHITVCGSDADTALGRARQLRDDFAQQH
jgi:5-(carboxyamino)imidazole ribonucleotide synthase